MTCSSLNTQAWYFFSALFPFLCILLPTTTTHACRYYAFMTHDRMKLLFKRSEFIAPLSPWPSIFRYTFPAKESRMVNLIVFTNSVSIWCPSNLSDNFGTTLSQCFFNKAEFRENHDTTAVTLRPSWHIMANLDKVPSNVILKFQTLITWLDCQHRNFPRNSRNYVYVTFDDLAKD